MYRYRHEEAPLPPLPPQSGRRAPPPVPPPQHVSYSEAVEGLSHVAAKMRDLSFFTDANVEWCEEELQRAHASDPMVDMLREQLPQRQAFLSAMDSRYRLTEHFPRLMSRFAEEDAHLDALLRQRLEELEAYRSGDLGEPPGRRGPAPPSNVQVYRR